MLIRTRLSNDPLTRLFESMFAPMNAMATPAFDRAFPPLNVWEDGENVFCEAELPGVRMEDLDLSATADELVIRGSRRLPEHESGRVVRRERMSGTFDRTISLPSPIDVEHVGAALTDGVLLVTMPKAPAVRARRIEVRGAAS